MSDITGGPAHVECTGDGLKFGYINHPMYATITTRRAGPGELTVFCKGPTKNAFCELRDHKDGTFLLIVKPQDVGVHALHVRYNDIDVPGSPFNPNVSPASLVTVTGPGVEDAILSAPQTGVFEVRTEKVGVGDVKVKVGGPRGAFKLVTEKRGRTLLCNYYPTETGHYIVDVSYDGVLVPGSPYQVYLANDADDLRHFKLMQSEA